MPQVWVVENVHDAVELAQEMRASGTYDWFRGQTRDWPPHSGLFRIQHGEDQDALARNKERFRLFCSWLEQIPALCHLLTEDPPHRLFAIAQHYGIPTHYIDFTTEPMIAGFFAADAAVPPHDGMSCIYCLKTEELMSTFDSLVAAQIRSAGQIETIEIDVTNLWRLQAQRGVFLYAPYNWDTDYPLDKIIFPYKGYPSYPPRDFVYPSEKSALEHLLDQYFDIERKHFGNAEMERLIGELQGKGVAAPAVRMVSHPNGIVAGAFRSPEELKPLHSWSKAAHQDWTRYPDEGFDAVAGRIERIRIAGIDRAALELAVRYGVKQALDRSPDLRARLVDWTLEGPEALPLDSLGRAFRIAWNGMRQRPFTNLQIAKTFSGIAGLIVAGVDQTATYGESLRRFALVRGDSRRVEFGYANRASSQGLASIDALFGAMRSDFGELVRPENHDKLGSMSFILQVMTNPSILFEFDHFVELFATDIIPSQIVLQRDPVLFDPAATTVFGLP